jgi:hypothetical protein
MLALFASWIVRRNDNEKLQHAECIEAAGKVEQSIAIDISLRPTPTSLPSPHTQPPRPPMLHRDSLSRDSSRR